MQLIQLQQQLGGALVEHFRRPVCGIYFLFDAADCLLYVGKSQHVPHRIGEHTRGGVQFVRVFFMHCTAADVDEKERHFIQLLQPPLNKTLKGKLRATVRKPQQPTLSAFSCDIGREDDSAFL
jgi:GIY-YIG catalytic domain